MSSPSLLSRLVEKPRRNEPNKAQRMPSTGLAFTREAPTVRPLLYRPHHEYVGLTRYA